MMIWSKLMTRNKVLSNGVEVYKDSIGVSNFLRKVVAKAGGNELYEGSFEELIELTKKHFSNSEPGSGSVNGDVILVNVPPTGFFTNIIEVTPLNENLVSEEYDSRVEGETPVVKRIIRGVAYPKANVVKIVLYRADTLDRDNNRSSDDEWEIVAINAQPEADTPMHPTTMLRNSRHEEGGTYREYSTHEWARSEEYWASHAFVRPNLTIQ